MVCQQQEAHTYAGIYTCEIERWYRSTCKIARCKLVRCFEQRSTRYVASRHDMTQGNLLLSSADKSGTLSVYINKLACMKIDVGLLDRRIDDEILGDEPSVASTFFPFLFASRFTVLVCRHYASKICRFIFSFFFRIYFRYFYFCTNSQSLWLSD